MIGIFSNLGEILRILKNLSVSRRHTNCAGSNFNILDMDTDVHLGQRREHLTMQTSLEFPSNAWENTSGP